MDSKQDPSRREFLQTGLALSSAPMTDALTPAAEEEKPNILLLLGEGQRADALSLAGNKICKLLITTESGTKASSFKMHS